MISESVGSVRYVDSNEKEFLCMKSSELFSCFAVVRRSEASAGFSTDVS